MLTQSQKYLLKEKVVKDKLQTFSTNLMDKHLQTIG